MRLPEAITPIRPAAVTLVETYGMQNPGCLLKIEGLVDVLDMKMELASTVSELISNCLDKGASIVKVTIETDKLIVEDDFQHEDVDLQKRLMNLNSERSITTKKGIGGAGIMSCRMNLDRLGGSLSYHQTKDNRIVAEAWWREFPVYPFFEHQILFVEKGGEKERIIKENLSIGWELNGQPTYSIPPEVWSNFGKTTSGYVLRFRRRAN